MGRQTRPSPIAMYPRIGTMCCFCFLPGCEHAPLPASRIVSCCSHGSRARGREIPTPSEMWLPKRCHHRSDMYIHTYRTENRTGRGGPTQAKRREMPQGEVARVSVRSRKIVFPLLGPFGRGMHVRGKNGWLIDWWENERGAAPHKRTPGGGAGEIRGKFGTLGIE